MPKGGNVRASTVRLLASTLAVAAASVVSAYAQLPLPTTAEDFHVPGTQVGDMPSWLFSSSAECALCHGDFDTANEPYANWRGSLMGQAGRDPLFYAQMTTANQDVTGAGAYCMRCHVPVTVVTGHLSPPDGSALDFLDRDGVDCHLCHTMVDPHYDPATAPAQDAAILAALPEVPTHYGNAMFVLDPTATRRGPRPDALQYHEVLHSPFHTKSDLCGTCHDVGNVAVTRQPDGTFRYNALGEPSPSHDPQQQFPLERTYTEWSLSAFADGGVDMGGRFGGVGSPVVGTCQDCHMPKAEAQACFFGPVRPDLRRHEFAGASSWALEIIGLYTAGDMDVDPAAIERGRLAAIAMVQRSASLALTQERALLRARVTNESGHKLPTGHIEGRRAWTSVKMLDGAGAVLREYGAYDPVEAVLDETSTVVYEMQVGLSPEAAAVTGLPAGPTGHMALADTIVKDTRIPPRGFDNAAFTAAGAPAVGRAYADGQYWDDVDFWIPDGARRADVTVHYQTVTRHYVEALRDGNHTDDWGEVLHDLWLATDKGPPVPVVSRQIVIDAFRRGDLDGDDAVGPEDLALFGGCFGGPGVIPPPASCSIGDFDGDRDVDCYDWIRFSSAWTAPGAPEFGPCAGPPGRVSAGGPGAGAPLLIAKGAGGALDLRFGASCAPSAGDFAIYEGSLYDFGSHVPVTCTTGGQERYHLLPRSDDAYYLVVPATRDAEGSSGVDGAGAERGPGQASCLPRVLAPCSP